MRAERAGAAMGAPVHRVDRLAAAVGRLRAVRNDWSVAEANAGVRAAKPIGRRDRGPSCAGGAPSKMPPGSEHEAAREAGGQGQHDVAAAGLLLDARSMVAAQQAHPVELTAAGQLA